MEQFRKNTHIDHVIYETLSKVISEDDITVERLLRDSGNDIEIVKDVLFEFYLKFNLTTKRTFSEKKCSGGSNCIILKLRSLYNLIMVGTNGMERYDMLMKDVNQLLDESTDPRRVNTRLWHSCHGTHLPLHVVCAYNDSRRLLEHPFISQSMLRKLIVTLSDVMERYMYTCLDEEKGEMIVFGRQVVVVPLLGRVTSSKKHRGSFDPLASSEKRHNVSSITHKKRNIEVMECNSPEPSNPSDEE